MLGSRIMRAERGRGTALRLCLALLGTACISPAWAQVPPGKFSSQQGFASRYEVAERMASCILRDRRKQVAAWIVEPLETERSKKLSGALLDGIGNCLMQESVTLGVVDLRGVMSERLLREDGGTLLQQAKAHAVAEPRRIAAGQGMPAQERLFDCVVSVQPADAAALIEAPAQSPDETTVFRKMFPALQACVPADAAIPLKPGQVRSLVATSLFRLVAAGRGA